MSAADEITMRARFLEAYSQMPDPVKNADNPAFKRDGKVLRYADLEAFIDIAKPILLACGFALIQPPVSEGDRVGVATRLLYKTGEEMDFGSFTVALAKADPQGAGAAITYCRRYALASIFGLAQEDDDANSASKGAAPKTPAPAANPTGLADEKQQKRIYAKAKGLGYTDNAISSWLMKHWNVDHTGDLTHAQATEAINLLIAAEKAAEKAAAEAAGGSAS